MYKFKQKNFFLLGYPKNDYKFIKNTNIFNYSFLFLKNFSIKNNLIKILYLVSTLFVINKNVLFVDNDINYNYLPIKNELLFNRSFKKLTKLIKYYNIHLIFYINLKKKKFIFKKLYSCGVINTTLSNNLISKKFDLYFNFNNSVYVYILYLALLKIYLHIKNNL